MRLSSLGCILDTRKGRLKLDALAGNVIQLVLYGTVRLGGLERFLLFLDLDVVLFFLGSIFLLEVGKCSSLNQCEKSKKKQLIS